MSNMFSRLQKNFNLDFLDTAIAGEQEKQKQQQQQTRGGSLARRTPSSAGIRRGSVRGGSSQRAGGRLRDEKGDNGEAATRGPDPDDFVIGDDASEISRVSTPAPVAKDGEGAPTDATETSDKRDGTEVDKGKNKILAEDDGLPLEVQQKLAKLQTLTQRYQDLLKNYRQAHAHVAAIEPFEATLREHTPLTSISDPSALVEFLNQRGLQSDMVKDELKRVSEQNAAIKKERDELKTKLDEAEKKAKDAFDEATGLPRQGKEKETAQLGDTSDSLGATRSKEEPSGDDAFFSYEDEISRATAGDKAHDDEVQELKSRHETELQERRMAHESVIEKLRSAHGSEVSELQRELKESKDYINELSTENGTLRHDFDMVRTDLDAQENKIRIKDNKIAEWEKLFAQARTELENSAKTMRDAQSQQDEAKASLVKTEAQCTDLQEQLKKYKDKANEAEENLRLSQKEHEDNLKNANHMQRDEKRIQISEKLIKDLKEQVKTAETAREIARAKVSDLEFYVKKLESESETSGEVVSSLRVHEANVNRLEKKLAQVEEERDDAQRRAEKTKESEAKIANLRIQLKRAGKDRDDAYQMILNCGKCSIPKHDDNSDTTAASQDVASSLESRSRVGSETTDLSTQPTEMTNESSTPATLSTDGGELGPPGDAKKKKKKSKSKAKKKAPEDMTPTGENNDLTVEDLLHDSTALKAKFGDNPLVPLFANMLETMKERGSAEDEHEGRRAHLEEMIEREQQAVKDKNVIIAARNEEIESLRKSILENSTSLTADGEKQKRIEKYQKEIEALQQNISEKDAQIEKLQERLKGEATLKDEIETLTEERDSLRDDVLEHGKAATDAKDGLQKARVRQEELQKEFDAVQSERDHLQKSLKAAEAQQQSLTQRTESLEAKISALESSRDGEHELVKNLEQEKAALQVSIEACEKQIEHLKAQQTANGWASNEKLKSLLADLDSVRSKAAELERDLDAANSLAQSRYKDLTAVQDAYNKQQLDLKRLREESAELKNMKAELEKANVSIKKLEAKERDLRSEISEHKSRSAAKETEIGSLKEKAKKSDDRSKALEESYETARKDLEKSETIRNEAQDTRTRIQDELSAAQDELKKARPKMEDLEQQVKKFSGEASRLREELQMKTAQHASSQSLMDSMQDQTRELATQMKELKEKNESLEEELGEAHRLLSERSREGETMRRLLADVESRADAKVKEMRERMDLAVEERDRAENDASNIGRKRAREVEELKTKLRNAEGDLARAADERQAAERRERDFKSRQDGLERSAANAQEELNEVRSAMAKLQDTIDETECKVRELQKEKSDLRKTVEDKETRLEKLQRSSRSMAEELRLLQSGSKNRQGSSATPSRSSLETSRVTSPVSRASNGTPTTGKDAGVDYVYLKNVLLQFLETKDKRVQEQLVSPLGMLLRLEPQDKQRLTAAIAAK